MEWSRGVLRIKARFERIAPVKRIPSSSSTYFIFVLNGGHRCSAKSPAGKSRAMLVNGFMKWRETDDAVAQVGC
jgi:hypothetical protein